MPYILDRRFGGSIYIKASCKLKLINCTLDQFKVGAYVDEKLLTRQVYRTLNIYKELELNNIQG